MLKIRKIYILSLGWFLCVSVGSVAQNHLNSPYSRFGMGDLMPRTSAGITAMGGAGYTFQSATAINFVNPASYMGFDTLSFLLDAGFSLKNRTLRTSETAQQGRTFTFDYLSVGFSFARWWKTALGIQPYSVMKYSAVEEIDSDTLKHTRIYAGNGGINEVFWGNSFKLFKNFSLGVNASFLFGTYSKNRIIEGWSDKDFFNAKIENTNKIKGAVVTVGTQYFIPIKDKGALGLGLVYTPPIPIQATENNTISTYWGTELNVRQIDTLYRVEPIKRSYTMPTQIGGGVSWGKKDKYFVGVDFTWKNWSNYKTGNVKDSLSDSYKIAIGGSYTPNYMSNKYFSRMTFSLGANIGQTHLFLADEHLNQFGINFGLLFPLKRTKSGFGLVLEYGQMGTTKNNLIKENYFTATINLRLHERWYQRKKLD